jgi:hypothetical protein
MALTADVGGFAVRRRPVNAAKLGTREQIL